MGDSEKTQASGSLNEVFRAYLEDKRIEFITFHPSYSYEEFIEGITVRTSKRSEEESDKLVYELRPGVFKDICKRALAAAMGVPKKDAESSKWADVYKKYRDNPESANFQDAPKYVLIIDEINRGDIAKIFGELITLVESDKRISAKHELMVKLPNSGDLFSVPPNLYIVATMNTADRSIALLDVALRRRFGFTEMNPDFAVLREVHIEKNAGLLKENGVYDLLNKSVAALEKINSEICRDPAIGRDRQIGHSFLFKIFSVSDLVLVWRHEILPLLEEYCYSDYRKINRILFGRDANTEWIDEGKGIKKIDDIEEMLDNILEQ